MKRIKRTISMLLVVVLLLSVLPTTAFAATVVASGYCGGEGDGTNLTWELTKDNMLTISGSGAMKDFAFNSHVGIVSVIIEEGVTTIGEYAFAGCSSLTSLSLPNSLKTIGAWGFGDCPNLTSVIIPNGVTTIGHSAFYVCYNLSSVTIPNGVTAIGDRTFQGCEALTSVTIPESVTTIGDYAFSDCSISTLDIPDGVTIIGDYAFWDCTALITATIGKGIVSIGTKAFYGCSSITSIHFEGNAPIVATMSSPNCSFPGTATLSCNSGTTGWTDSVAYDSSTGTWNGYNLKIYDNPNSDSDNKDTSLSDWTLNGATYDSSSGEYTLTEAVDWTNNSIWYNKEIFGDFSLEFDYYTGSKTSGADGIAVSFYAKENYSGKDGEWLGFDGCDGYGVELDTYRNTNHGDPTYNHIAIIGKSVGNHLQIGELAESEDNAWHHLKIVVEDEVCNAYVDGQLKVSAEIASTGHGGLGISAATGDYNNRHAVKNIKVNCGNNLDNADPNKYAIIVQNSNGEALEGVTVTWNNETAVTNKEGIVSFRKFTAGEPVITAAKAGYVPYSNENSNYKKSSKGYDVITLYTLEEGSYKLSSAYFMHKNENTDVLSGTKRLSSSNRIIFSLQCGIADTTAVNYKLIQGSAIKAESTDGLFSNLKTEDFSADEPMLVSVTDASGLICKTPINLQFVDDKPIDKNSIKLGGEALSLTLDENVPFLGGKQLKFDMPYTPIDVYISGDTVHLGINVDITDEDHDSSEKKIQKLKGLIGTIQHMQKTETQSGHSIGKTLQSEINFLMKDKNQKAKWGPVDASLSFIGYGEGKFDENGLAKIKSYMCLTGSVSTTLSGPTVVLVVVPVTYSITFSAKGELAAEFEYDLNTQTDSGDLALTITPGLKAFGGVGIGKAVGAGAYGSAELPIEIQLMGSSIEPGVNYVDLTGELGLKAYLGPLTYEYPWKYKTWHLYTRTGYSKQTPKMLRSAPAVVDLTNESQYYLDDLNYLEDQSEWLGYGGGISLFSVTSDTTTANELTPLQIGTYRNMQPVIGAAGETPVMVWVTANTDRGDYNYPQLVYSVYQYGAWQEPMPVDDNDTLDTAHTLYTAEDGTLWLAYQDTAEGYNTADLSDFAASQTIRVARFDEATGAFTDFVTVSEPGVFSRTPVIAEQDGVITVMWVSNADNSYFGENTTNTLCYAQYENGTWGEAKVLASGLNAVTETAIGHHNGVLSAAVITDGDNDLSTTDDRTLWLYDGLGQAQEIANGSISAVTYAQLPSAQVSDLLWSNGGSLMAHDTGVVFENSALSGGFTVLPDRIIYNGADGEDKSNLFAQIYDNGTWTTPVHVTVQEQYLQSYAAAQIGGQTYLAAAQAVVDITADSVDETCTLSWAVLSGRTDAAITAVDVDYSAEAPSAEVPVHVDVANLGDISISEYTVTIGEEVSKTVTTALAPGETATVELLFPLGETVTTTEYAVKVATENDGDDTNDTAKVTIGHCDLAVYTEFLQAGENRTMLVKVANEGAVSADGTLSVTSEAGEPKTVTVDTLEPGEFSLYRVEVTSDLLGGAQAGLLTATVTPNATEWNQLNNRSTSYVEVFTPTAGITTAVEKTSMVLGNDLSIMFAFTADDITGTDNYATITKSYADGTADRVERIEQSAWGDPIVIGGKNYYAISFDGIAAKEMTDEVQVQIFNADGMPISEVFTDSIRDYAMRMIEQDINTTMFVDMLVYGAEAQKQFESYGIDDLATSQLTAEQLAQATQSVSYENKLVADDGYRASSLILESNIQLAVLFGGIDPSMTAEVSFTDHYGETKSYTIAGSEFEPVTYKGEACYSITVDELVIADARQLVTITVKDTDGNVVTSATDSVESYIARMSSTGTLYEAIMKFSDSAAAGLKN